MQITSTKPAQRLGSRNSTPKSEESGAASGGGDRFEQSSTFSRLPGMVGRGLGVAALGAVPLMGVTAQAGFTNKHVPSSDYNPGSIGQVVGWAGTGANLLGTALLAGAVFGEGSFTGAAIALGTSSALAVYNDLANSKYEFIRKG